MKYILIDVPKQEYPYIVDPPEKVLCEDIGNDNKIRYVCEVCYKDFPNNLTHHLSNCSLKFPIDVMPLLNPYNRYLKIVEFSQKNSYSEEIDRIIERMSFFSKQNQGLGIRMANKRLLGEEYYNGKLTTKIIYYVLFRVRRIIGYSIIQRRTDKNGKINSIIISDIYIAPDFRGKNYGFLILQNIASKNRINFSDLWYGYPVSNKLKSSLKKNEVRGIWEIQGENVGTLNYTII